MLITKPLCQWLLIAVGEKFTVVWLWYLCLVMFYLLRRRGLLISSLTSNRQRERFHSKDIASKTTALNVSCKSVYTFLPSLANDNNVRWLSSRERRWLILRISICNLNTFIACIFSLSTFLEPYRLNRSRQLRNSEVWYKFILTRRPWRLTLIKAS